MKIAITPEGRRLAIWSVVGAVVLGIALWALLRTPTTKLEQNVATTTAERKAEFTTAKETTAEGGATLERVVAGHAQSSKPQDDRIAQLERQLRQQGSLTAALLAERTQARQADAARVATASSADLRARAAGLVGEISAPDDTYRNVIALARDRDQARDELGAATEKQALLQQLADERKSSLETAARHYEELKEQARQNQESCAGTIARLEEKVTAEAEANAKLVKRLKGNSFWRAVKTGAKVSAGIGIGIAIGRAL